MTVSKRLADRDPAAVAQSTAAGLAADLTRWIARASAPVILEIRGEPWIGKTRLLQQVAGSLTGQGWRTGHACARPPATVPPLTLLADAAEDALRRAGADIRDTLTLSCRAGLGVLFRELRKPGAAVPGDAERTELAGRALRELVLALAGPSGLLLAVDNAHWADPASIAVLEYLLRTLPSGRLGVIVVHRNRQSPPRLSGLLASLPGLRQVKVGAIPRDELALLLPPGLTRSQRALVLAQADGNPGLAKALSAALRAVDETAETPGLGPFEFCLGEFRALSADGWLAAQSAAILGTTFPVESARELAGIGPERFNRAFDELAGEDIVRADFIPGSYHFRNHLLRSAAYYSASEMWRANAHAAALTLTAPAGAPLAPLHWTADRVRSGLLAPSTELVTDSAARLYDRYVATGKALVVSGRLGDALDVLDRTTCGRDGIPAIARAQAAEWRVRAHRLLGRHAVAMAHLAAVRERIASEPEAVALVELARIATELERGKPLPTPDSPVVHSLIRHADPLARAYAQALLAAHDADLGRVRRATVRATQAAELLDQFSDIDLVGRLDALYWLARAQTRLEQDKPAVSGFERGLGIAEEHGLEYLIPQFATGLAESSLRLGRVDLAFDAGCQGVRSAQRTGSNFLIAEAQAVLAQVAWSSGDRITASRAAQAALSHAGASREPWADRVRVTVLATVLDTDDLGLRGDILTAGILRRAAEFPVLAQVPAIGEVLARVESARSTPSTTTARWADAAEVAASQLQLPGATGLALLARAHLYREADPLAAAAFAASAAVVLTRAGRLLDVARAYLAAAAAWMHLSDAAVATSQLTNAQALIDQCGAHGYLDHVSRLNATAASTASRVRLEALSEREREIATLVSDGRTNQQIARKLRLSHKTVETYLSRIFKKLGVSSRAQVAASIGRAEMSRAG